MAKTPESLLLRLPVVWEKIPRPIQPQQTVCTNFQKDWNHMRDKLKARKTYHIKDIALGVTSALRNVNPTMRLRALALHAALWKFRTQDMHLPYTQIIAFAKELLKKPTTHTR